MSAQLFPSAPTPAILAAPAPLQAVPGPRPPTGPRVPPGPPPGVPVVPSVPHTAPPPGPAPTPTPPNQPPPQGNRGSSVDNILLVELDGTTRNMCSHCGYSGQEGAGCAQPCAKPRDMNGHDISSTYTTNTPYQRDHIIIMRARKYTINGREHKYVGKTYVVAEPSVIKTAALSSYKAQSRRFLGDSDYTILCKHLDRHPGLHALPFSTCSKAPGGGRN